MKKDMTDIESLKRVNLVMPIRTFRELQQLAIISGCSMSWIVRLGITILGIMRKGQAEGLRLGLVTQDNKLSREFILPIMGDD